jgi:hypothetical protein
MITEIKIDQSRTAKSLSKIRAASTKFFFINHSMISYDILIAVIDAELSGKELTLKSLFNSLPYSIMGIRLHLNKLISDDWIVLEKSKVDARSKLVKPKEKLRIRFLSLATQIDGLLN